MKKIFTLSVLFSLVTYVCAQGTNKIGMTNPDFISEFNQNEINVTGISHKGEYIYGMGASGSAAIYAMEKENPFIYLEATPSDYFGISIAGITTDDHALISNYSTSYFLDLNTNDKVYLESPDPSYGLDAWDMSADGSIIGCNLTTEDFIVIPMVANKQEDGTYKMTYLEYDPEDAMGCMAQYTQVRFVSDDGKYLMGIQPDNRGMGGRPVIWVLQEDGTYKFTTPLDDYIYDFTYEKPGAAPEWDDYVTADPELEPELFNQQMNEYNKIFDEYEKNYAKFTRNRSSLEIYMMNKGTRSNMLCMAFWDNRNATSEFSEANLIPVFYDCETNTIKDYPEMTNSFAFEQLPGGGHIVATDNASLYSLTAIDNEGNKMPFEKWLAELTGTDITSDFEFTFWDFMNDQEITGVFPGLPHFSNDGKTLALGGVDPDSGTFAAVLKFDSDVFASTTTGIKANVTEKIVISNNNIFIGNGKHGVAEVYTVSGAKCGSYDVEGSLDLNGTLASGAYIVKVNIEGQSPVSMKMIVK